MTKKFCWCFILRKKIGVEEDNEDEEIDERNDEEDVIEVYENDDQIVMKDLNVIEII